METGGYLELSSPPWTESTPAHKLCSYMTAPYWTDDLGEVVDEHLSLLLKWGNNNCHRHIDACIYKHIA